MRMIIGILLFWISVFGYLLYFKKKTKLPYELLLPIIFSLIGIIMFVAGILNMMKEFTILICLIGIILFIYKLYKKEIQVKKVLNINFIIVFVVFLYLTIICGQMQLLHYDNFSHWGLIIKNMFLDNNLPNFENPVIDFKNYQPGSACFIYYFGALVGKTEGSMIIAQNYLIASYFFSLLTITNLVSKKNNDKKKYITKVMLIAFYIFILFANISFNDLLVDTLISTMSICSFVIMYYFKDDLKKAFIYNLPIIVYLFLVKNTGIVLAGFSCLGLIYLGYRNKQFKKGFIYAIISGIITVAFFYIWTKHVSYVYGDLSLYSKHSLSTANIITELRTKGIDRIFEFCTIYWKHFIDIFNNLPNKYMIGINLVLIIMMFLYKKEQKDIGLSLIIVNIIYIMYYLILGLMYLLSMPWSEAVYLAGFDRYMMTIIFIIIGIVLISFINVAMKEKNTTKKTIITTSILMATILFISFKYYITDYNVLTGDLDYKNTRAYMFDDILKTDKFDAYYLDYYYIYAPIQSNNDSGYVYHLARYKLNTPNLSIIKNIDEIDENIDDNYIKKIIVLDEAEEIIQYIENNGYTKKENIYIKENKSQ